MNSLTETESVGGGPASRLSVSELACLSCIAGYMIPASVELALPGGNDAAIVQCMGLAVGRDHSALVLVLRAVDDAAGGSLAQLPPERQRELLASLRTEAPGRFAVVEAIVSRAYYRDARVLASLGMEERAPFPSGYEVETSDWDLLKPVAARGQIFREAD